MSIDKLKKLIHNEELNYNYDDSYELQKIVKDMEEEADSLYYQMNDEDDAEVVKITLKGMIQKLKFFIDGRE